MKRRNFLSLALATPFVISSCCKNDNTPKENRYIPSRPGSFDFLEVEGSYYEIGYAIGKRCSDNIGQVMKIRRDWVDSILNIIDSPEGSGYSAKLHAAMEKHYPHYLEEIRGMADGAGIDYKTMWSMSIKSELAAYDDEPPGCSTIYYRDEKNNWLFHNEDGHNAYHGRMLVVKAHPPSGVSFITLLYPGLIAGVGPAINSAGLVHTCNFIGCKKPLEGIPRYFLGRAALEAKTMDEAITTISTEPRAFPWHHNIASIKTGKYASVETLPEGVIEVKRPGNGIYIHTNHTIHKSTKDYAHQDLDYANSSSISRYEVLTAKAEKQVEAFENPGQVMEWLASHEQAPYSPCRHPEGSIRGRTLGTAFFDLNKGSMKIYKGNPCESVPNDYYYEFGF